MIDSLNQEMKNMQDEINRHQARVDEYESDHPDEV